MFSSSPRFSSGNLDSLNTLLDCASVALDVKRSTHPKTTGEGGNVSGEPEKTGILFTGNAHEAVPRRLLLDKRLTPLERNAWQVFRLLLNDDGLTSFPSYQQLRSYLSSTPFKMASKETVAKAITTLRLTRWLSLAGRVRDEVTGQMKGNIYLLHDEPISISEAILLDCSYLTLVGGAQEHANKSIREVAAFTLLEFASDPHVAAQNIPSRLEILGGRVAAQSWTKDAIGQKGKARLDPGSESEPGQRESELSEKHRVRNGSQPGSDSEPSGKPGPADRVRNPNSDSTCTNTNTSVCKSSVPRAGARPGCEPFEVLEILPVDQRQKAMIALALISEELQGRVLEQWARRCSRNQLRNPLGYLLGMVDKARNGEFDALGVAKSTPAVLHPQTSFTTPPGVATDIGVAWIPHTPTEESRALAAKEFSSMMAIMKARVG